MTGQIQIDFNKPSVTPKFNGPEYRPGFDQPRLNGQIRRVYALMSDGQWRTLQKIAQSTGDPQASVSAQLRHLRKERFGGHTVLRRPSGDREHGLFEYKLIVSRMTRQ